MVKVKICGLTRKEDAELAVSLGASALGFIFTPTSKRYNSVENRQWISELTTSVLKVGVFVDQSPQEIKEIVSELKLDIVQLHGKEKLQFIEELGLPVWKSITIDKAVKQEFPNHLLIQKYLIDSETKGISGGTGISFDWNRLSGLKLSKPFVVAGGINPENVLELLENKSVEFIDVNSGIEDSPGIKNHVKMKNLFARIGTIV